MLIVGIAGGTGSGKTTVVKKIAEKLPEGEIALIPQDSYYKDNSHLPLKERQKINFNHPNSIEWSLLKKHIQTLQAGEIVGQPIYSYLTCTRAEETIKVHPKKVIIIEGILCLSDPELRDMMDLKVFVHADADDRLTRVVRRDIVERGRSVDTVLNRYEKTVKPSHLQFIEPTKKYADIIVPQGGENKIAIDILTHFIKRNLK
jgi:uridine kinase